MTPSPFGAHAKLVVAAAASLKNAIDATNCHATVLAEIDWIVHEDTVVRPDVLVVCGSEPARHVESAPAIVIEVLSESTRLRDLTYKRRLYETQKVPHYFVLDPTAHSLVALELQNDGTYSSLTYDDTLRVTICKDGELELAVERFFR